MSYSIGKALNYMGLKDPLDYCTYYVYGKARCYAQPYINTYFNVSKINDNKMV